MKPSEEQNVELVRRSISEILDSSGKNYDLIDELYTEDFHREGGASGELRSRDELRAFTEQLHEAFPDLRCTEQLSFCDGDFVATRLTYSGTHDGEFNGIPATGKQVTITGNIINRIEDGRIAEGWVESDQASLLRQVGAIPEQSA